MEKISDICQIFSDGQFALLDNNKHENTHGAYVFTHPLMYCIATVPEEIDFQLAQIEKQLKMGRHAVGYFSYEWGYALHPRLCRRLPEKANRKLPLFCVGIYEERMEISDALLALALREVAQEDAYITDCHLNMTRAQYLEQLGKVKQHICDGDTYQVNYTLKYKFRHAGSPLKLYAKLRERQRVEYGAFLDFPDVKILSRSPELFIQKQGDTLLSKPMKGTYRRGETPEQDQWNFQFLSSDEKSRAENVMIVDLLRNDFSRISQRGSVKTSDLFEVQTYDTLHQMVSTVSATVDNALPVTDLLKEIFPCGSITGAPKIRTMEIIQDLECEPRGVYTGAIGYIAPTRDLCFNVPIRTLVLWPDGRGEMGVGSGIVHDSDPEAEYEECLLKGAFFTGGNFSAFPVKQCRSSE